MGTQTAAVGVTGSAATDYLVLSEEYDGTNWTVGGALPAARHAGGFGTAGTQTAALQAGGYPYLTTSLFWFFS